MLPPWFSDNNPILNALLAGASAVLAAAYALYLYAAGQARIATASGVWLDIIAQDFFGLAMLRGINESDNAYRARILANLFRPKATRSAISESATALTGQVPEIIEPFSPADCGAYGVGYCGYGATGSYGSSLLPAQAFIVAYRPLQTGIAMVSGYGYPQAGYSLGSQSEYASLSMMGMSVADASIHAMIDDVKAAGVTIWTRISSCQHRDKNGPGTGLKRGQLG